MKAKKYIYRLNKNIEVYKAYIKDKKLLNYFKNKIKKEIGGNNYNTNVKGKMSLFDTFIDDKKFSDFINNNFLREMYYMTGIEPLSFDNFQMVITSAWGNILHKGDYVKDHEHGSCQYSTCLYFSKGEPFRTEIGDFEIEEGLLLSVPGYLKHWVNPVKEKERITLVWNWNIMNRDFKSSNNLTTNNLTK